MATALEVVEQGLGALGIPAPASLTATSDDLGRQCRHLLKEVADYMIQKANWPRITFEATLTSTATDDQGDLTVLIPNFRRIVKHTMFNRTQAWRIYGPVDGEQWQRAKTNAIWLEPGRHWRKRGDNLLVYGQNTAGQVIAFEYLSRLWLKNADTAERYAAVQADTNEVLLEDTVMQLGFQARWLHANGLEYAAKNAAFEAALKVHAGEELAADKVSLDHPRRQTSDPLYPYDVHVQVS